MNDNVDGRDLRPHISPIQEITDDLLREKEVKLFVKRDDMIHPHISGNKWRKMKYNIPAASKYDHVLTFGGAYSNHIAATAAAGKEYGFNTIGVIRGEEHLPLNDTLYLAREHGMRLHYVDRATYKKRYTASYWRELEDQFGACFIIPEGGANALGVKGCMEILDEVDIGFDIVCSPCGTGSTLAGIIASMKTTHMAIGFPALKNGGFIADEVRKFLTDEQMDGKRWHIETDYHFGGYARYHPVLIDFIRHLVKNTGIPFDPVYTGKMMFGIFDMIKKGAIEAGQTVLAIHTGGLQGISGFEKRYAKPYPMPERAPALSLSPLAVKRQ